MHFVSNILKKSMTQVQLPHSAVYQPSTSRSNNSSHGPYTGDKLISMQCAYTNCLAEPLGRAGHVNPSAVLSNKQANRMSTQGGVMALTASVVLQGQLEDAGVLSGPNLHALVKPPRPQEGPAAQFMANQFNVREWLYVYTVAWHQSLCNPMP